MNLLLNYFLLSKIKTKVQSFRELAFEDLNLQNE